MRIEITAVPRYWMHLTLPQAKLIQRLASMHYDSACKAAGVLGGFVYGWVNWLTPHDGAQVAEDGTCLSVDGEPIMVSAFHRELDTVLKIMEFPPPCMEASEFLMVGELRKSITDAIKIAEAAMRPIQLVKE